MNLLSLVPSLIQPNDLIETISSTFVVVNMSNWIINRCSILSFDIEIYPKVNSTEQNLHQFYSFKNHLKRVQIDNLYPNQDYQLRIKVNSQAGEIVKFISFRTNADQRASSFRSQNYYIILIIIVVSTVLALISSVIVFIAVKFCRLHLKHAGKHPPRDPTRRSRLSSV